LNPKIFGEYEIVGTVGVDLTEETVYELSRAIAAFYRLNMAKRISLGRDARLSSLRFRDLIVKGLTESGCDIVDAGVVPTPVLSFIGFTQNVDGGVMITASHHPPDCNGFKIILGKNPISGDQIRQIRDLAVSKRFVAGSGGAGEREVLPDYLRYLISNMSFGRRAPRVVVDAGNGVGGITAVPFYRSLGCEVIDLFTDPDGRFPNHPPDPAAESNTRAAAAAVTANKADAAIVLDGDGDRIAVVDETGAVLSPIQLLVIFSRSILKQRPDASFIVESDCSQSALDDIRERGGSTIPWRIEDASIKDRIGETGAVLACCKKGHFFFADRYYGYDDAVYAGARLLEILSLTKGPLSSLLSGLPTLFAAPETHLPCPDDKKLGVVWGLIEHFRKTNEVIEIDGARIIFEHGWGLVRPARTRPELVLRFEADTSAHLDEIQNQVRERVEALIPKD